MIEKTSIILEKIAKLKKVSRVSIRNILKNNADNGYFIIFLMAIFSLIPTPSPFPIISFAFGIVLVFLSIQLLMGKKRFYLPHKIKKISFRKKVVDTLIEKIMPFLKKTEIFAKNRMQFFKKSSVITLINIIILLSSFSICTPIPLTNTLPAVGIILITFGILNEDGLFVIFGIITSIIGIASTILGLVFGKIFIIKLLNFLK